MRQALKCDLPALVPGPRGHTAQRLPAHQAGAAALSNSGECGYGYMEAGVFTRRVNRPGLMSKITGIPVARPVAHWLLLLAAVVMLPAPRAGEETGPVDMLQGMADELIAIADSRPEILDDPAELRKVAFDVVLPHVDFLLLSRRVLGKDWRTATAAQQEFFVNEFRELLLGTYLRSVSAYRDNRIRFQPLRTDGEKQRVMVNALVEQKNGPPVHTAFRLHRVGNEWLIYDVIVEGISLVATHRSTFAQVIHNHGIEGLIERLREKNALNSADEAAGAR